MRTPLTAQLAQRASRRELGVVVLGLALVAVGGTGCGGQMASSEARAQHFATVRPDAVRTFDALEARAGYSYTDVDPVRPPSRSETAPPAAFTLSEGDARCPEEMSLVGGKVCVDRWEGSLVRLKSGHEETMSPYESVDGQSGYRAVSRQGVIPQGYISGAEAEVACRASGKRLCTSSEWSLGCRGPQHLQFPYGNERRAHVCNDDIRAKHPVMEAVAKTGLPKGEAWKEGMNLPLINQLPDSLLPTGERSECVSPDGLFDMVGNLHEWVADADGTFRGGYYMDTTKNGDGCSYQTTAHDFDYHDYSTGFRCCADPDSIE